MHLTPPERENARDEPVFAFTFYFCPVLSQPRPVLSKLLRAALDNSGAERAVIILEQEGRMLIQGEALAEEATSKVLHSIPLAESHNLPLSVLHHVVAATREHLLLDEPLKEPAFAADPYLQRVELRSLLILPLLLRGALKGLIYLENRQAGHVFTPERVEALQVLSSQVSVSLDNAVRFASLQESHDRLSEWNRLLEQTVQERTTALRNLLDNAGQGFLTFGPDLLVGHDYSAECIKLFGDNIGGKKITSLLFPGNEEEQAMLEEVITQISEEQDPYTREIYLSLLPEEVELGERHLWLEFKLLPQGREQEEAAEGCSCSSSPISRKRETWKR